jgi:3-deoxy-D-arabino-heptulosonate 7-phosphate (DAHP) synthase
MKIPKINISIYCLGIQVLSNSEEAESDESAGSQSLKIHKFPTLMKNLKLYVNAAGRI